MVMSDQNPFPLLSRKRRAAETSPSAPPDKRLRPNLSYGFSGLSLDSAAWRAGSIAPDTDLSEDERADQPISDLGVEEVDTSSTSSSEGSVESDTTFRKSRLKRSRKRPLQPDSVEQPTESAKSPRYAKPSFIFDSATDPDSVDGCEMDMDEDMEDYRRKSRRKTRTEWYEPEKDRIVITSLGSSDSSQSSSRSSSPQRHLSQPGAQGFTLSPSLLTHLLSAHHTAHPSLPTPKELVLYRPPPRPTFDTDVLDDAHRFEAITDEDMMDMEE